MTVALLRARATNGEDIHLWMFIYQQKGSEVILDGNITQTLLVTAKFPDVEEKAMRDRPYVNKARTSTTIFLMVPRKSQRQMTKSSGLTAAGYSFASHRTGTSKVPIPE